MRSFIIRLNLIGLLALCLFACNRRSSHPLLHRVDSLLAVRPDSARMLLDSLPALDKMSEADRAYYALLLAEATDKAELPLLPCDSLLNFALDYYGDNDREKAVALLYKGRLLAQMGDKKAAIEQSLQALEILKDYPEEIKYRGLIYSQLGVWYEDCKLYDKALEMLNQSLFYSFNAKDTSIIYNNISNVYAGRDMKDPALMYQRKAVDYAMRSQDTDMMIASWHNLSMCYKYWGEIDSAMLYAHTVIQHALSQPTPFDGYLYNIGDLYIDLEQYDSAKYYLEKSLLMSKSQSMPYWSLATMEAALGNYRSAYHYLDTFVMVQDSLDASEGLTEIQHLVYKHQTESRVKDEQMKSRYIIGIVIFIFLVLAFILIVYFIYKITHKRKQQALLQQSLDYAREKVQVIQQRVEENKSILTFLQNEQSKNVEEIYRREQLIEELKDEISRLRTYTFQQTTIYKKVISLSSQEKQEKKNRKPLTIAESEKLKETVLDIYSDYVSSLKEKHPRLTEDDLFLLCLQQIGFSSLVIAMCFGYSDTLTINQRKSRLKTKMS